MGECLAGVQSEISGGKLEICNPTRVSELGIKGQISVTAMRRGIMGCGDRAKEFSVAKKTFWPC